MESATVGVIAISCVTAIILTFILTYQCMKTDFVRNVDECNDLVFRIDYADKSDVLKACLKVLPKGE